MYALYGLNVSGCRKERVFRRLHRCVDRVSALVISIQGSIPPHYWRSSTDGAGVIAVTVILATSAWRRRAALSSINARYPAVSSDGAAHTVLTRDASLLREVSDATVA